MPMTYPSDDRRWRNAVRHVAAVLLCCPMAMAAEDKPSAPTVASQVGELYRVQEVHLALIMTKDPTLFRREIVEQISETCRAANATAGGVGLWDKNRDRAKLSNRDFNLVATFPDEKVKIESVVPIDGRIAGTGWLVQRGDGGHFSQTGFSIHPEPWSPGTQVMSSNLTREKRLGPCPAGWTVGEHRWLTRRKLKQMPPPEFPDGPIDKLKR